MQNDDGDILQFRRPPLCMHNTGVVPSGNGILSPDKIVPSKTSCLVPSPTDLAIDGESLGFSRV